MSTLLSEFTEHWELWCTWEHPTNLCDVGCSVFSVHILNWIINISCTALLHHDILLSYYLVCHYYILWSPIMFPLTLYSANTNSRAVIGGRGDSYNHNIMFPEGKQRELDLSFMVSLFYYQGLCSFLEALTVKTHTQCTETDMLVRQYYFCPADAESNKLLVAIFFFFVCILFKGTV